MNFIRTNNSYAFTPGSRSFFFRIRCICIIFYNNFIFITKIFCYFYCYIVFSFNNFCYPTSNSKKEIEKSCYDSAGYLNNRLFFFYFFLVFCFYTFSYVLFSIILVIFLFYRHISRQIR
ncbi:hypothetical protein BMS3Abin17_00955 [archaeon BMS3Abin17]|nr:hypothetical protein BMS3Abin17_00955 [archaeon BMS3Abin17]